MIPFYPFFLGVSVGGVVFTILTFPLAWFFLKDRLNNHTNDRPKVYKIIYPTYD